MINYYPFELHTHTKHSDGSMSPRMLVELALERGLKGIALTDHNTDTAREETKQIGKELGLTIIDGIEWTTFWGHITVLGGNSYIDWRDINNTNIDQIIAEVNNLGDLINIAHPKRMGLPVCAGCNFEFDISSYQYITGFEVWSNPNPASNRTNEQALEQYDELCSRGIKLACLYGDDWHDSRSNRKKYAKTYLGIDGEVNPDSALQAIKNRRTYISTGITINLEVRDNRGSVIELGQTIDAQAIDIKCQVETIKAYCEQYSISPLNLILKGSALSRELNIPIVQGKIEAKEIVLTNGYLRIEIEGQNGENITTLLLTSPIYVEV